MLLIQPVYPELQFLFEGFTQSILCKSPFLRMKSPVFFIIGQNLSLALISGLDIINYGLNTLNFRSLIGLKCLLFPEDRI
jgi:hypothetical protein